MILKGRYIYDENKPESVLGEGMYGKVFKGYDLTTGKVVAIKLV